MPDDSSHIIRTFTLAKELEAQRCFTTGRGSEGRVRVAVGADRAFQESVFAALGRPEAEFERFERALAEHERVLDRVAEETHKIARGQGAEAKQTLRSALAVRKEALEALVAVAPTVPNPVRVLIDAPFMISPSPGLSFEGSQIVPANSSAKFTLTSSASSGSEEMTFSYQWTNPANRFAVINLSGYIVLNGHCQVRSSGGFFAGNRFSSVRISGVMHILDATTQPPSPPQITTSAQALALSCHSGSMFDDGSSNQANVFRGFDLQQAFVIVPPQSAIVIQVAAGVSFANGEGKVTVDFGGPDFEVLSPAVLVTILT